MKRHAALLLAGILAASCSSSSTPAPDYAYGEDGGVIGTVLPDGAVIGLDGGVVGNAEPNGFVRDPAGNIIGSRIPGGFDAGNQNVAVDASVVAGFGTVAVTWTVNGMPPETGCAAAGAANVRLQVFFGRPEMVPCTQGRFEATRVSAAQLNIGADLLRADGTVIYAYNIETTVSANQVNNVNVPFEPPGNLRVRWTINGNPASTECAVVNGYDVRLEGRRLTAPARPPTCRAGQYTFSNIQPGEWSVSGSLTRPVSSTMLTRIAMASGSATVASGETADLTLEFAAEPPRDQ